MIYVQNYQYTTLEEYEENTTSNMSTYLALRFLHMYLDQLTAHKLGMQLQTRTLEYIIEYALPYGDLALNLL